MSLNVSFFILLLILNLFFYYLVYGSPTRGSPACIMWPAATPVNDV